MSTLIGVSLVANRTSISQKEMTCCDSRVRIRNYFAARSCQRPNFDQKRAVVMRENRPGSPPFDRWRKKSFLFIGCAMLCGFMNNFQPALCLTLPALPLSPSSSLLSPDASLTEVDLQPPHSVQVDAKSANSFTLTWQPPDVATDSPSLTGFSVFYTSGTAADEREVTATAENYSTMISDLQPATNYTVHVVARYSDNQSASSLKFIVSTLSQDRPVDRDCECYKLGTARGCPPVPTSSATCVCNYGYGGLLCNECSRHFYMIGGQCEPCNCSSATSSGDCVIDVALPSSKECSCLPGHLGPNCDTCIHGYFWYEDVCLPCQCLLNCPENQGHRYCKNCELDLNRTASAIQQCSMTHPPKHRKAQNHGDGTVAVVAVIMSLAFIALVAGGISCYRYKCQGQSQHSLWSMELHEEKVSLNSACDYQRLDAAAIHAKQESAAGNGAGNGAGAGGKRQKGGRVTNSHNKEGHHKYHCISI